MVSLGGATALGEIGLGAMGLGAMGLGAPAGCLVLAVALAAWPTPARTAPPGPTAGRPRWAWSARPSAVAGLITAGAAALGPMAAATVVAGPSGLLAAAMLASTVALLASRMLDRRRRRRGMPEILRGLRALGRELRSGADPLTAARGAAAAATGAGGLLLDSLVVLMRTVDESPARAARSPDDPAGVLAFLSSGWLLSRRHGVAFGRVVTAVADELSDQLAADQTRTAQLAGPRMSGYVMAALPLMGVVLGAGMGVDPVAVLLGSPLGNLLLVIGVALLCAGLLWSARIVGR